MLRDDQPLRPKEDDWIFDEETSPMTLHKRGASSLFDGDEEYAEEHFALARTWAEIRNLPDNDIRGGRSDAR